MRHLAAHLGRVAAAAERNRSCRTDPTPRMRRNAAPGCAPVGRSGMARHTRCTGEWSQTDGAHCGPPQRAGTGRGALRRSWEHSPPGVRRFRPPPSRARPAGGHATQRSRAATRRSCTCKAPAWKRRVPTGRVAQWGERWTREPKVAGSSPGGGPFRDVSPPFALGVRPLRPCGLLPIGERLVPEGTFARAQNQPPSGGSGRTGSDGSGTSG